MGNGFFLSDAAKERLACILVHSQVTPDTSAAELYMKYKKAVRDLEDAYRQDQPPRQVAVEPADRHDDEEEDLNGMYGIFNTHDG